MLAKCLLNIGTFINCLFQNSVPYFLTFHSSDYCLFKFKILSFVVHSLFIVYFAYGTPQRQCWKYLKLTCMLFSCLLCTKLHSLFIMFNIKACDSKSIYTYVVYDGYFHKGMLFYTKADQCVPCF